MAANRLLPAAVLGLCLLALGPLGRDGWAAHFPSGSRCYDCHAVSRDKMVAGTHLLKKSDKTVALGITGSSTPVRCLFCHEKNAVSAAGRTEMLGVWDHFDATSTSRHAVSLQSTFTPDPAGLDCLDCHPGLATGVVSDGSGNAKVHGLDAATQTVNRYATLLGGPAGEAGISASTCQNPACHDADGGGAAQGSPPPRHATAAATVNGVAPTSCTQCHGDHNSYQNTSLIVLRDDGTTSNNPGDPPATAVTPAKCGVCHTQDDGANAYATKGHGRGDINGGSIGCTGCHSGAVPHGFSPDRLPGNLLRFGLNQDTSLKSAIRRQAPYDAVFSVCLTCHATLANKVHGQGPDGWVGCNDCHEPHGVGVGANARMVRATIPKVDVAGAPVYGDGASGRTSYEANTYATFSDAYRADGAGVCDNAECHQGKVVNGDALYPLSSLMTGGRHTGGDRVPGAQPADADYCERCHSHRDGGGSWAAADSCKSCHGQPPVGASTTAAGYAALSEAATPHRRHAGGTADYAIACQQCHAGYVGATHDTTPTKSYQDVLFDAALNPTASYDGGTRACLNLYCHSDGQSGASVKASVAWNDAGWDAVNLTCHDCHGGIDAGTRIATGAHGKHLAVAGVTCSSCHADTVAVVGGDATTDIAGKSSHVNGVKDLRAGGGAAFAVGGAKTCTNISCHGGGSANWNETLGCAGCHLGATDRDNFVYGDQTPAAVSSAQWLDTGHGRASAYPDGNGAAALAGPSGDPQGCAYCHSFLGSAPNPAVAHGVATNPFRLANKSSLGRSSPPDGGWNDVCLVCHSALDADGYDPDGAPLGYAARNGGDVGEAHVGSKHGAASAGGTFCWDCHDPHGDAGHLMVQDAAAATTDGVYGVPTATRPVTGLDAQTGGFTSDDLVNPADTGLCQTCHASSGGANFFNRSTYTALDAHNGADQQVCTVCHQHTREFTAGCLTCHGSTAGGNWWPDSTAEHGSAYPNRAGAHAKHIDAILASGALPGGTVTEKRNMTCSWCHPKIGHVGDSSAAPADVNRDGTNASFFKSLSGAQDPNGTFNPATHACSATTCHGGSVTPAWYLSTQTPTVASLTVNGSASPSIQQGSPTVNLRAVASDTVPAGGVAAVEYFDGTEGAAGAGLAMSAEDGAFGGTSEAATATVTSSGWTAGTRTLYVDARNGLGNWGPAAASSINVTVTPKDAFTVALANGATETVHRAATDTTVAVLTFAATAVGTSARVDALTVTLTGTGTPYLNVATVKIYNDNTGTVPNAWDAGDVLLGTAFPVGSNVVAVDIADTTVTNGTPVRMLVAYDITSAATLTNTLGAQLTAVTSASTDTLTTALPLSSTNMKTINVIPGVYYLDPSTGVNLFGVTNTNLATCGTAAITLGTHYTLSTLSPPGTPCGTSLVWTPGAGSPIYSYSISNTVLDAARDVLMTGGAAAGNRIRVQNTSTTTAYWLYLNLVELLPTGGVGNISGSASFSVAANFNGTITTWDLSAFNVTVRAGSKFGIRYQTGNAALRLYMGASQTYVTANRSYPLDVTNPSANPAPVASPSSIQQGTQALTLTATCSDVTTGNSKIAAAEYFVGTEGAIGTGIAMQPADGAFNSPTEAVTATLNPSAWAANTNLYVDCRDAAGLWGPPTAGVTTVTVTPKDQFSVAGTPAAAGNVLQGSNGALIEKLTFTVTSGTSVLLQRLQVTGTASAGSPYLDVSQVKIYGDSGAVPGTWDATDPLLGSGFFNGSNAADIDIVDQTVTSGTPATVYVVYDVAGNATVGHVLGANLSAVTYPTTDNLTTVLPVASGNLKTVVTGSTLRCDTCHAMPPNLASNAGSHGAHVKAGAVAECDACHPGASSYTVWHQDGVYQLGFSAVPYGGAKAASQLTITNAGVDYYADATANGIDDGTCSNTPAGCHAGSVVTSPVWGGTLSNGCLSCHAGSETSRSRPIPTPGSGPNRIDQSQYEGKGHGLPAASTFPWDTTHGPGFAATNRGTPNDGCEECHERSAQHAPLKSAADPYRLGAYATDPNGLCARCHGPGGTATKVDLREHSRATTGSPKTWPANYEYKCVDCHDPHADSNWYMVKDYLSAPQSAGDATPGSDAYGTPRKNDANMSGVTFTSVAGLGAGSYIIAGGNGICEVCHNQTFYDQRGDAGAAHYTTRCTTCHGHKAAFAPACESCHDGSYAGAPQVVWPAGNASGKDNAYGSHLKGLKTDTLASSTNWASQCNQCHTGHHGSVKVPLPPASWSDPSGRLSGTNMVTRLGLGYTIEANTAVHLGGTATSGATEAEVCWNCHQNAANSVSEWGYNTKTTPAGFPVAQFATATDGTAETFDFGWIYQSNYATKVTDWTAGYWMDQYDPNLRRRIASMHTASFDPAGQSSSVAANIDASGVVNRASPTLENKSYIRCTYCHDVHDLNRAQADTATGRPHLRGTWMGNPYPPELPPRSTYAYTTQANVGVGVFTPRGRTTSRDKGGYFIDQNSGWPTRQPAMDTLGETAGLCTLCHGSNVDAMDFYTGTSLWQTTMVNGHSNSTVGGTRANARDIFTADRYGAGMGAQRVVGSGVGACSNVNPFTCDGNYPLSFYFGGPRGGGGSVVNSGWYNWTGTGSNMTNTYAGTYTPNPTGDFTDWYGAGVIGGASGAGSMAHEFTCSKCHTPHASGLPALLTQNCIDPSLGNFTVNGYAGTNPIANNCHRKTTKDDGWHRLAPAQ